jgi:branched-chain amino acid transport system ATP-binding protein
MSGHPLLGVAGVKLRFGGIRALDGVDLVVNQGEFLGVIGPNGAGKTTLFNVITGVYRPNEGHVRFDGHNLSGFSTDQICRMGVARTYQKVRPFPRLSVLHNVLVPILNRSGPRIPMDAAEDIARELLERVGLGALANREARNLNLFHRKKIELARALGAGAKLVLLDEVMAGLTPVEADAAIELLRSLKQDFSLTVVCIEHLMRIIMALSDRIVVLDHGRVIATGRPAEVAANPQVQDAYLGTDHA